MILAGFIFGRDGMKMFLWLLIIVGVGLMIYGMIAKNRRK